MGRVFFLLILWGLFTLDVQAAHLVGGDLSFQCQGNNRYNFKLTVYRDRQSSTGAVHDQPAYLFIYDLDNNALFNSYSANYFNTPLVPNNDLGPCLQNPAPPDLDFATYNYNNINLPPNGRGYRVVYQRCCRSPLAQNLTPNFDGTSQGSTYEVVISPSVMADCNGATTLPSFNFQDLPPTQWCANELVTVDQTVNSDILAHADSVVYSLCAPYEGGSGSDCIIPDPTSVGNCSDFSTQCAQPCAYTFVNYAAGYNAFNPMGAGSTITIDPQTGLLTVVPSNLGVYTVGICATAYKNGQQWTSIKRDFQFKVFDCVADAATDPQAVNGAPLNPVNYPGVGQIDAVWLVCSEFTVQFAQSSNNAINHFWDFGVEGVLSDTSVAPLPSFTFPDTGTYLITYVVNRNEPCVDTAYGLVKIFPRLVPGFAADVGCFSLPVQFTDTTLSTLAENQVTDWLWDFGDASGPSTVQNPSHVYASPGMYIVSMTIETALGCIDTYELMIQPEPSPVAAFDNLFNCAGEAHVFENLSQLNGVELESYSWDFGDGNDFVFNTTDVAPPPRVYADSGVYDVALAVSSTNGCSDTARAQLVVAARVHADFRYEPASVCPGQQVDFYNLTPEYYDSLLWNIDGTTFTVEDPSFTFTTSGPKQVSLILYSNEICGDSLVRTIDVQAGPLADFAVDSTCVGQSFTFLNNSSENGITIDSFVWDFGDGTTTTGFSPAHTYNAPGTYTVELVAMTSLACKDTITRDIPVKEELSAMFLYTPDTICEGVTQVFFENISTGGPWDSVLWEFGDDSSSTAAAPDHLYAEGGLYPVTMTLKDDICTDAAVTETIEILDIPFLDLPDTLNICDGIVRTLTVDNPGGTYVVFWSTGDSLVDDIQVDNSIDSATVFVDNRGCSNSDLMVVTRDCPAYLPNTFSPNGDGVNDVFIPFRNNITSFTLRIFNRWGEEVFSSSDFDRPWDGRFKGENAPVETYVYTLTGVGLDAKPLMQFGTVSIIR